MIYIGSRNLHWDWDEAAQLGSAIKIGQSQYSQGRDRDSLSSQYNVPAIPCPAIFRRQRLVLDSFENTEIACGDDTSESSPIPIKRERVIGIQWIDVPGKLVNELIAAEDTLCGLNTSRTVWTWWTGLAEVRQIFELWWLL